MGLWERNKTQENNLVNSRQIGCKAKSNEKLCSPMWRVFRMHALKEPLKNTELEFAWNQPRNCDNYTCFAYKTEKRNIAGPVYYIPFQGQIYTGQCQESYIGETERSLKSRFLEHRRPSSTSPEVFQHIHIKLPGHHINLDEIKIIVREPRYFERGVKEPDHSYPVQSAITQ